jgi:hypothetical protein
VTKRNKKVLLGGHGYGRFERQPDGTLRPGVDFRQNRTWGRVTPGRPTTHDDWPARYDAVAANGSKALKALYDKLETENPGMTRENIKRIMRRKRGLK